MDASAPSQGGDEAAELRQQIRRSRPWRLRRRQIAWGVLIAGALGLRLIGLGSTGVWHDEAMSIHTARMGIYEQAVDMAAANNQPPLFFLLLKTWAMVSWSPVWLRLMSVLISLVGVIYAVRWVRLWDQRAGWMAGALVATSPLMIHYAQEIRAYALLYACTLAGLYYAEWVARSNPRWARAGLLICTCVVSYAHYVGLLIAATLWLYTWLRGGGLWRTAVPAAAWAALVAPIVILGVSHASDKAQGDFWIEPLTGARVATFASAWIGHEDLRIWRDAGSGAGRSWSALVLAALLSAGMGLTFFTWPARREAEQRLAAVAMWATALSYFGLVVVMSLAVVPIALARTTFPTFIPLIGVMALSCAPTVRRWIRVVGTVACVVVVGIWAFTWPARVYAGPERRPPEQTLFAQLADRLQPGDLVIVFPADLQASAGYFLDGRARQQQIHSTDQPRLIDTGDGLRLVAQPRKRSPVWFADFRLAVAQLSEAHPSRHGVWLVDLGPRSAGDPDRRQVTAWLDQRYFSGESVTCGARWTLAARYYLPKQNEANGVQEARGTS